ncbi:MAG: hypothetical protein ACLQL2_10490 [Methylovirgula sp.]
MNVANSRMGRSGRAAGDQTTGILPGKDFKLKRHQNLPQIETPRFTPH